jgi:hypothetical protein
MEPVRSLALEKPDVIKELLPVPVFLAFFHQENDSHYHCTPDNHRRRYYD